MFKKLLTCMINYFYRKSLNIGNTQTNIYIHIFNILYIYLGLYIYAI